MVKFVCRNCNYRFESELKQKNKKCPYCNEAGGLIEEPSAEDLLLEE